MVEFIYSHYIDLFWCVKNQYITDSLLCDTFLTANTTLKEKGELLKTKIIDKKNLMGDYELYKRIGKKENIQPITYK